MLFIKTNVPLRLNITASDKQGRDFRNGGHLTYVNKRYLRHQRSEQYSIKAGADAPEGLLGYADFDSTAHQEFQ